ncbi:hypothetical protein [Halosimplex pelagicum]|uniref:Uncharacterized protein n=1 Tax=Halosimplex pelagicum TaxID=869886 RepID=A0A7D5PBE2_9EURY|nr:hypothetical protein [Halosimplex pelagicum]QLH82202.1 hypothetical protein HZS54_11550 [Halosimplex pelagicum]
MSATNDTNASTDSNQTVAVIPTGITGNPYYIRDVAQFVAMVEAELENLSAATGPISDIVIRGSYQLAKVVEENLDTDLDVESHSMDFRTFLDDEGEDEFDIPSVIGDGQPVVKHIEAVHGSEVAAEFDLNESDDRREYVDGDVLSRIEDEEEDGQSRIGRAKAKSKGKATEQLLNDYFDWAATADHVVILEDGTDTYEDAATDVRGDNNWVKYATACDGQVRSIRMSGGEDGVLNWTHAMLVRDQLEADDLSDSQVARLNETLDEDQLENHGVPVQSDDSSDEERRVQAEAQAVAGEAAAPADD